MILAYFWMRFVRKEKFGVLDVDQGREEHLQACLRKENLCLNYDLCPYFWFLYIKVWVVQSLQFGGLEVEKDQS